MGAGPLEHRYGPRGTCREFFASRASEIVLSGPAGTGKSRACLEKLFVMALKYPGMRGIIVRKTAVSLTWSALVTWNKQVIAEALLNGTVEWFGGNAQEPAQYRFANGSVIVVGGMDKPTKIMSTEYDVAYVQEATEFTLTDWESLLSRLRNGVMPYQQLMADCNPDRPTHWLYLRAQTGDCVMLHTRHQDNPLYFDDAGRMTERGRSYIVDKLGKLSGVRRSRLLDGLWVAAEGLVYDEFNPNVHLRDPFSLEHDTPGRQRLPQSWPRYWVVDFGFVHPFVWQCWAVNQYGELILYREVHHTRRIVEDHAATIKRVTRKSDGSWREPMPAAIICDHDAEDRATLERHLGMNTQPARKSVSDGIQAVKERMKVDPTTGRPRILLCRDSLVEIDRERAEQGKPTSTVDEVPGYVWDTSTSKAKDFPLKVDDDGMDCMRYMVAYLDLQPKPRADRFVG